MSVGLTRVHEFIARRWIRPKKIPAMVSAVRMGARCRLGRNATILPSPQHVWTEQDETRVHPAQVPTCGPPSRTGGPSAIHAMRTCALDEKRKLSACRPKRLRRWVALLLTPQ